MITTTSALLLAIAALVGGLALGALWMGYRRDSQREDEIERLIREADELRQSFERQRQELAENIGQQLGKVRSSIITSIEAYQAVTETVRDQLAVNGEVLSSLDLKYEERATIDFVPASNRGTDERVGESDRVPNFVPLSSETDSVRGAERSSKESRLSKQAGLSNQAQPSSLETSAVATNEFQKSAELERGQTAAEGRPVSAPLPMSSSTTDVDRSVLVEETPPALAVTDTDSRDNEETRSATPRDEETAADIRQRPEPILFETVRRNGERSQPGDNANSAAPKNAAGPLPQASGE